MDRSARHGPNRLSKYIHIHESAMGQFIYRGLVDEDRVKYGIGAEGYPCLRKDSALADTLATLERRVAKK